MTDKQRADLVRAVSAEARLTTEGFVPSGVHWRKIIMGLDKLERDLDPPHPKVPPLGPIFKGGISVLAHDLTHATDGIALYPAFDDAFRQGVTIIAPEDLVVDNHPSSSRPGHAFYATGISKIRYWFAHLDRDHPLGTHFNKGDKMGLVGPNGLGGGPHCHVALNIELLVGKGRELEHHVDYTHGAPTVGAQLSKLLA